MGSFLVAKLVKPTKVFSRSPYYAFLRQFLPSQAKADVRTAGAGVLGRADAAVGHELTGLDSPDRVFDQAAIILSLFVGDGSPQILDFDQWLAHEDDLGDLGDAGDPGVADQLRIESQKSHGFFRIAARRGLPFQQTPLPIQLPEGIDIGYEVVRRRGNGSGELYPEAAAGLTDPDAVVLGKALEQLDALLQHAVPGVAVRVVQASLLKDCPLSVEGRG
jgi:hypothetical protein